VMYVSVRLTLMSAKRDPYTIALMTYGGRAKIAYTLRSKLLSSLK